MISKGSNKSKKTLRFFVALVITIFSCPSPSLAYPISVDIDENDDQKCFHYVLPDDDDVHVIAIAIPPKDESEVEPYYIKTIQSMTKDGGEEMSDFPGLPSEIKEEINEFEYSSGLYIKIDAEGQRIVPRTLLHFHKPMIFRDLYKISGKAESQEYDICFQPSSQKDTVTVLFEVVPHSLEADESEDDDDHVEREQRKMIHKEHFTPLENNFQASIKRANKILSEMRYMERREQRMRQTADSTNLRVKYFSYLSVTVLITATYLQVTYLKSYFKKKKLM